MSTKHPLISFSLFVLKGDKAKKMQLVILSRKQKVHCPKDSVKLCLKKTVLKCTAYL